MADCIFCKILAKEMPNHTVYEDEYVLAFLDVFPHAKGHTIVIPKKHYSNLSEMPIEVWQQIAVGLAKTLKKVKQVLNPEAVNIAINDGKEAGQVVPHVHWHIMPRWSKDGGGSCHSIIKNPGDTSVEELAKLFGDSALN